MAALCAAALNLTAVEAAAAPTLLAQVPLPGAPFDGIAITPDGAKLYVSLVKAKNPGVNTIAVIDTATNAVVDVIDLGNQGADKTSGNDLSADALLTRADGMAAGNPTLAGLIKDARATKSRGATRGPTVHRDTVLAGNTDVYTVSFRGGEQAAVLVSGDGDTDLDLYVTDENGNAICSDTDTSDTMLCRWRPRWTGSFLVDVRNKHDREVEYVLAANDVRPGTPSP